jgi:hypothetical protein
MTREQIEACWRDPLNRKWGFLYFCKSDPRVIVPKHPKWMGWTANFAHPSAVPITLLLIAVVAVPVCTSIAMQARSGSVVVTVIAAVVVLCILCRYLSSRTK